MQKPTYKVEENRFVIENYNEARAFGDFFPGIGGKFGVPLWAFFVSRGQGIAAFGVGSKDHSILEFRSLGRALEAVGREGFRTFVKIGGQVHEPFRQVRGEGVVQRMSISTGELELQEVDESTGLTTSVLYYPVVESPVPALVRRVRFKNRGNTPLQLEVLDGVSRLVPYGALQRDMAIAPARTESITEISEVGGLPLFRVRSRLLPSGLSEAITGGNFLFSLGNGNLLKKALIVDPVILFADPFGLDDPVAFRDQGALALAARDQVRHNRFPCAFTAVECTLGPGEGYDLTTCIGFARDDAHLEKFARQAARGDFLVQKRQAHLELLGRIKENALCVSNNREFDEFMGQTFLDNALRGGLPTVFETARGRSTFPLYSRHDADLEQDHRDLNMDPTYFSQGRVEFDRAAQARRLEPWFFPEVQDGTIHLFLSLIQTDGYNPREMRGVTYSIIDDRELEKALKERLTGAEERLALRRFLSTDFTPGTLVQYLEESGLSRKEWERILSIVMSQCTENEVGAPGAGFQCDHWHYGLDLIESYLAIFPDQCQQLLIGRADYTFFDNPDVLTPRADRLVLVGDRVRQVGALQTDPQKERLLAGRTNDRYRTRVSYGRGRVYQTHLLAKLLCVAANKVCALDVQGIGLELETGRTGAVASLDGLPALLGSSVAEAYELERFCAFLHDAVGQLEFDTVKVFEDLQQFVRKLLPLISKRAKSGPKGAAAFHEAAHSVREKYLEQTRHGVSAQEKPLSRRDILTFAEGCLSLLADTRSRGPKGKGFDREGFPIAYVENQVTQFIPQGPKTKPRTDAEGRILVKPKKWAHRPVARFLEGPARFLATRPEASQALAVYEAVRNSTLYDEKLEVYRMSGPLTEESVALGHITSWQPGWMDNEGISTTMALHYLLSLLQGGLAAEFYRDIKGHLAPFWTPAEYGRSIFENVSYIVSSAYPEKARHGQGLRPRLSSVSAEVMHMWTLMTAGPRPFTLSPQKELRFGLRPLLAGWMFTTHSVPFTYRDRVRVHEIEIPRNSFAFRFLGNTLVVYRNDARRNTYDGTNRVESYLIQYRDGTVKEVKGESFDDKQSRDVRAGKIFRIDAVL